MKKNTNINRHPLLVGNLLTSLIASAVSTLTIDFVLSAGMNVYQIQSFAITIIAMLVSIVVTKNQTLTNIAYNNFGKFMLAEGIINIILAVATIIVGSPMIYVISSIVLVPFTRLQMYGTNKVVSESFEKEERLKYDNAMATYGSYVAVAGIGLGFVLNRTINGPVAFAVLCAAEVVNNCFYYAAYKKIQQQQPQHISRYTNTIQYGSYSNCRNWSSSSSWSSSAE